MSCLCQHPPGPSLVWAPCPEVTEWKQTSFHRGWGWGSTIPSIPPLPRHSNLHHGLQRPVWLSYLVPQYPSPLASFHFPAFASKVPSPPHFHSQLKLHLLRKAFPDRWIRVSSGLLVSSAVNPPGCAFVPQRQGFSSVLLVLWDSHLILAECCGLNCVPLEFLC